MRPYDLLSHPLVSILIPCFNAERYIADAIESALGQDYPNIEVIVLDDGSTDESLKIIRHYVDRPNYRWETGPNRGGNAARNRLLSLARGEFVQYLDADDRLDASKISKCLDAMGMDVDMVFCDYVELTGGARRTVNFPRIGDDIVTYFTTHGVQTSIPLHRIQPLREVGGFDESLPCCQEYEFHLRLARKAWRKVAHVPEALCMVTKVAGSVSSNEARVFALKARIVRQVYVELRNSGQLTPERADAIATVFYTCGRHLARHDMANEAAKAFELSRRIAPNAIASARWPMRALAGVLGPVRAEQFRRSFCRVMGRKI